MQDSLVAKTWGNEDKKQLCLDLLSEFGAKNVTESGYELIHSCSLPYNEHKNGDANPSASLNYQKLAFNCFGCQRKGGLSWFIAACRGQTTPEAQVWLLDKHRNDERSIDSLMAEFDDLYHPIVEQKMTIPTYDPDILKPWYVMHPYLIERGIPEATIRKFRLGWNPDDNRIVIPHFWKGKLVGWQSRRVDDQDGSMKYKSVHGFPKRTTLYNHTPHRDVAVIVESPMSVLAQYHVCPYMEATFGASVTEQQNRVISGHEKVILWFDQDQAGWRATEQVGEAIASYTNVWTVMSPWDADPAEYDPETVAYLLDHAVPLSLWRRPYSLEPWGGEMIRKFGVGEVLPDEEPPQDEELEKAPEPPVEESQ